MGVAVAVAVGVAVLVGVAVGVLVQVGVYVCTGSSGAGVQVGAACNGARVGIVPTGAPRTGVTAITGGSGV